MKSLLLLALFFPPFLWRQQSIVNDGDPPPKWKVDIDTSGGKEVRLPSPAMRLLPQCRGGMCYAVFAMNPPLQPDGSGKLTPPAGSPPLQMEIAGFTLSGQSHFLDLNLLQGLTLVTIQDFAPDDDGGVFVLIHATEKASLSSKDGRGSSAAPTPGFNQATPSHKYLVAYDSNGQLRGIHHLDLPFDPIRMASLTDQILVSGFDTVQSKPVLAILGTDGSMVRLLDDQGTLPNATSLIGSSGLSIGKDAPLPIQRIAMGGSLSKLTFGYAGGRALLLDPGADAAIWEIKGTEVEKTNLKMPRGVVAASIVPSDGAWLIRAFVSATDSGMLLEFDRETGELKRQVDSGDVPATSIFLESGNTFYALWWDARNQSFVVKSS